MPIKTNRASLILHPSSFLMLSRMLVRSWTPTCGTSSAGTSSGHRHAVLARAGQVVQVQPAQRRAGVRRPEAVRRVRGRLAPCLAGHGYSPLGAARLSGKKPVYVFETGGTTGIPEDAHRRRRSRIDYEMMSDTLPDKHFPRGSHWLMLGPSGPRRLRLAIEHLAQHRGGICFCVDLDPRWVVKLLKERKIDEANAYKDALHRPGDRDPGGRAQHQVHVHDAEAARRARRSAAGWVAGRDAPADRPSGPEAGSLRSIPDAGHHRHLLRRHRVHAAVHPRGDGGDARKPRVHDADLRQHADGPGVLEAGRARTTGTRSRTTPRSRGP